MNYILAALVAALAVLGFTAQHYKSDRDKLQLQIDGANANAQTCTVIEDANAGALAGLQLRLQQCVYDGVRVRSENQSAVAGAIAAAARAGEDAGTWRRRYNDALQNPSCAAVARMPICPELQRQ